MDPDVSEIEPESQPSPVLSRTVPPGGQTSPSLKRARLLAVAAALVATFLSWGAGEAVSGKFQATRKSLNPMEVQFDAAEVDQAEIKNATLAYGLLGSILGLTLGLAGGLARGAAMRVVTAGVAGLVLGGLVGGGGSFVAFTALFKANSVMRGDLLMSFLSHLGAWVPLGGAAGFAFGLGLGGKGRISRALIGGLAGAAIGTVGYEMIGGIALPLSKTSEPIAGSAPARLLAYGFVSLFTALGSVIFSEAVAGTPRS